MEANEIIRQIVSGNQNFMNSHNDDYHAPYSSKQNPVITLVSCSDSRVQVNSILPDAVNRIFKIENIGNQVITAEGSVEYGVHHLRTPVLMILGHSDCGAIKAAMKGFEKESDSIKRELNSLKPAIKGIINENSFNSEVTDNVLTNIDYQVKICCEKFEDLIAQNKLTVLGAYYDFNNDFKKGKGRLIIVNVNNNKNPEDFKEMPYFEIITAEEKKIFTGRI